MLPEYLECGKVINTHGCAGALKSESYCDSPRVLADLKNIYFLEDGQYVEFKIAAASVFKSFVIMKLEGIDDLEAAEKRKGSVIYAARKDIPVEDGSCLIADLIGLDVIDADNGTVYGKLKDVINRGASDIYVVDTEKGEMMIPAVDEFIVSVEVEKGIFIRPIEGLIYI